MQILLTEEEYKSLKDRAALGDSSPSKKQVQELCTLVADKVPIGEDNEPWGCILTQKGEWYCDDCIAQHLCPSPNKEWSK